MEQAIQLPARRLEIQSTTLDGEEVRIWALLIDRQLVYQLRARGQGYWELCTHDKQSFEPPRIVELKVETPPYRLWPSEAALAGQIERIRTDGGEWIKDLLPWTPLLIFAITKDDKTPQRRAILALLCAGLISADDLDLRFVLFQIRRLACRALADLYESEGESKIRGEMEPALRRSLYAWQEEISRDERRGFFGHGVPLAFTEPAHPLAETAAQRRCVYAQMDDSEGCGPQEQAMLDLLLTGPVEDRRLRAFFQGTTWGQEMTPTLIRGWFLPRYNLDSAERLKRMLGTGRWSVGLPGDEVGSDSSGRFGGWSWPAALAKWGLIGIMLLMAIYFGIAFGCRNGCDATARPLSWLVVVCGLLQLPHWFVGGAPDTSLPRLRAGMFLAVVGTVLQQNWDNLLQFGYEHPLALCLVVIGLFVAAFQVLESKVASATTPDKRWVNGVREQLLALLPWRWSQARRRSGSIIWRGLALSLGLSLLLVDLLGDSYVESLPLAQESGWMALSFSGIAGGVTYPSLVLLFTAILLFAGIFGQLLGSEKPLTEAVA